MPRRLAFALAALLAVPATAEEAPPRPDLLTFARGALPVQVSTGDADLRSDMGHAVSMIDGDPRGFVATRRPAGPEDALEITYALPALTRFDRFAVPNVLETPSPSQTFFARVEVFGAADSAEGPWLPLASGDLARHPSKGEATDLALAPEIPEVRWVRLRLSGALDPQTDRHFLEFSEIVGEGVQRAAPLSTGFDGVWSGRGVKLELAQDGAAVTGCYDGRSRLSGTVEGAVLRALGADDAGIPSQFVLIATPEGGIRGLRSSNGAPFRPYDGEPGGGAGCLPPEPPRLGCGSVVHGIGFAYDSDAILPEARGLIEALHAGLAAEDAARIAIVGHASSEGAEDYNRDLSRRRAAAVVDALAGLGLDPARLSADGRGEEEPIASNADEAGRSLNRRVEVRCTG